MPQPTSSDDAPLMMPESGNLDVLNYAARLLLNCSDRRELARTVLETLADFSQTNRLTLLKRDPDRKVWRVEAVWEDAYVGYPDFALPDTGPNRPSWLDRKTPGALGAELRESFPLPDEAHQGSHVWLLPIVSVQGQVLGHAIGDLEDRNTLPASEWAPLRMLASLIALSFENMHMIDQAGRDSRARYRAIVDQNPDLIVRLTPDRRIMFANNTFCHTLNQEREAMIGSAFELPVIEDDGLAFSDWITNWTPNMSPKAVDVRVAQPDETIRWHHWTVIPVMDDADHFLEYQAVGRDTTLQRFAEEERRQIEIRMLDAQKLESLGVMAGGIAHDFNNLLATVLGNLELAIETPETPAEVKEYLSDSRKATIRAAELSREMLLYAGQHPLKLRPLNINQTIDQIRHLFESTSSKNARIIYQLDETVPEISADPAQVHQLLVNLVANANEALGDQRGEILIRTGHKRLRQHMLNRMMANEQVQEGDYVYCEVQDTGSGIQRSDQRKIFEPFYSTKFIGRGLGLAAVHGIMRAHKGAIKIVSAPGRGATFRLYFPIKQTARSWEKKPDAKPAKQAGSSTGQILLVDDEASVRQIVEYVLTKSGFKVVCATDGVEGLELFKSAPDQYDAVLMDLKMPRMGGDEAFRQMREINPDTPVIMMTGYSEEQVIQFLQEQKPAAFIQKPFEVKTLLETLHRVV